MQEDKGIPLTQRYYFKANVWIFIFSYVGNYFWTHYFYKVLHAYYTFPVKWQLNEVRSMVKSAVRGSGCASVADE